MSIPIEYERIIDAALPWNDKDKQHYQQTAFGSLRHDYEHQKPDPLNCGGCALRMGDSSGPNYAGWQRIYVEAGLVVPRKWRRAFFRAFTGENQAFAAALARSCKTFGVMVK